LAIEDPTIVSGAEQASTGAALSVERFTKWDDLEAAREEWNAFNERTGGDIYESFEWLRTWWEFYGRKRELDVRVVRSGGEIVAVFRFFRERLWLGGLPVGFVRLVGCDFGMETGGMGVAAGAEDKAVGALRESMGDDWDVIHLGPIGGFAEVRPALVAAFEKHFQGADVRFSENVRPHPIFDAKGSMEEFLKQVEKHQRQDMLRLEKLLGKAHKVEHRVRETKAEVLEALPGFFESHDRMWQARGMRGYFNEWPKAKEFHRRLVERLPEGSAVMCELLADGAVVAQQFCHRSGDTLHWFQPARDESAEWKRLGVGNIGFLRMVEWAISRGIRTIDSGGAPIDYKVRLGARVEGKRLVTITRCGLWTHVRVGMFRAGAWLFGKAYGNLWYLRIAPRVGMGRGAYWAPWIKSRMPWA